jgi:hypothetical protein
MRDPRWYELLAVTFTLIGSWDANLIEAGAKISQYAVPTCTAYWDVASACASNKPDRIGE